MDHKAWIWRKKSSEKTKVDASATQNAEEAQTIPTEKETIEDLNEKLDSALLSCQAKDKLLTEQTEVAQEAIAAQEKAETEAERLKQELRSVNESLTQSSTEFEACKEELSILQQEHERKAHELENLSAENAGLIQAVEAKEKMIGSLCRAKTEAEAEFGALMVRSESASKENAFLKYEFHILKEEIEFYRRSAIESVKKVTDLESECKRLRALLRKKLPGPSAMAKMRESAIRDDMEEENKNLKEIIFKMSADLSNARASLRSLQDFDNALVSERIKNVPELKAIQDSDMNLMDDFVEMEKLAIVSVSSKVDKDLFPVILDECDTKHAIDTSIRKIMNLVEGFDPKSSSGDSAPVEYSVRVFQWRNSDLSSVLQRFVQACNDLLKEDVGIGKFVEELSLALEWILNNYAAAPAEASTEREKIKQHIVSTELQIQKEVEIRSETVHTPAEKCDLFIDEDSELQELKNSKESTEMREDKVVEKQTLTINEDLDTEAQLTAAKAKLNEVFQKVSCLEVELEDKRNCCEELEATCLELQLQLESVVKKEIDQYAINEEEKQAHKDGWEIKAASVKLAECQETILHLGKQLKALSSPNSKNLSRRSSLLDQMLAEDTDKSPQKPYLLQYSSLGSRRGAVGTSAVCTSAVGALSIVPVKKQGGGGFLRRLLLRRKKGNSKKKLLVPK